MDIEMQAAPAPALAPAAPAPAAAEEGNDGTYLILIYEPSWVPLDLIGPVGGIVGISILITSFACTIISTILIFNANNINESLTSTSVGNKPKISIYPSSSCFLQAYTSAAALFVPLIVEQVYGYIIVGATISSLRHDHPRIEGKRSFQLRLPFYWAFILLLVICYIVGIYDMHIPMPSDAPVYGVIFLQYMTLAFTMTLHWMAVEIQSTFLARRWLDEFPVVAVEVQYLDVCSVCLEVPRVGDVVRRLPCGHDFHRHCVDEWLMHPNGRRACPLCNLLLR